MSLSILEVSPVEVLEEIVLWLVAGSLLGPPNILPLLLASKRLLENLSITKNPHLYARMFELKFDIRAPVNRLGAQSSHLDLAAELVKRFETLHRFKNVLDVHHYDPRHLTDDLWRAYLMFLENDGKNSRQLVQFAKIDQFASAFVALGGPLHAGADENDGWTVNCVENSLALWLFWFTDRYRVPKETALERRDIIQALAPIFVGSPEYTSTHAPITSFKFSESTLPSTIPSLPASPFHSPCTIHNYFGSDLTLAHPLFSSPALLSCVVRLEIAISEAHWPLSPRVPATRAEAIAIGWESSTLEDHAKAKIPTTRFAEGVSNIVSQAWYEHDWMRLFSCFHASIHRPLGTGVFTPGMLQGVWVGRWFGIPMNQYYSIIHADHFGQSGDLPNPPLIYPVPMQFRLREHHQMDPDDVVGFEDISTDGTGEGAFNAWLPADTKLNHADGHLNVNVPDQKPVTYADYDAAATWDSLDKEISRERGVWDIILTAETDEDFAVAWGHREYHGRVRAWDGLIILVRGAAYPDGRWIFRGYVHGMQNLVGVWRETAHSIDALGWEGVWSMTKVEDV